MSVNWEIERNTTAGNESSVDGNDKTDDDHTRSFLEQSSIIPGNETISESEKCDEVSHDDGGGGDMKTERNESAEQSPKEGKSRQRETLKLHLVIEDKGIMNNRDTHTDEPLQEGSKKSEEELTGLHIVAKILEELIDAVIAEAEEKNTNAHGSMEEDQKKEGGSDFEIEREEEKDRRSIQTIKSIDDSHSIIIGEEQQAQLALEQKAAAFQKQQEHEKNIALYHHLIETRAQLKRNNNYLLKQMFELYRKEKMEHMFKEISPENSDMEGKYFKLLFAYYQVRGEAQEEEHRLKKQARVLEEKRAALDANLEEELESLLDKERCVGRGLIFSQTAKPIPDKMIEKLIHRQVSKSKEVSKQRLTYFKLRDAVSTDENLLKSLQTLGDNLTLMEYEQLKMQNQSCVEKLEERDADLQRLRSKATSAIQALAEIREKSQALLEDIEGGKVILHDVNHQLSQTRERLGCEKKRRDMIRSDAVRLRHEAGLLSEPKLLKDYKESLAENGKLSVHLKELKNKFELQKQRIASLRNTLSALTRSNN